MVRKTPCWRTTDSNPRSLSRNPVVDQQSLRCGPSAGVSPSQTGHASDFNTAGVRSWSVRAQFIRFRHGDGEAADQVARRRDRLTGGSRWIRTAGPSPRGGVVRDLSDRCSAPPPAREISASRGAHGSRSGSVPGVRRICRRLSRAVGRCSQPTCPMSPGCRRGLPTSS